MMLRRATIALVSLAVLLTSAMAVPPERPAPGAVIDEVAQYTGLTNDAVSLALKDNAAALGRLTDAVQAVQIAQQFLDARDAEIATTVFYAAADTAAEALLPPPLMTAIKAVRVYKSMLEAARDKIVIPALDRQLYAGYRAQREQNQDRINAFSYATSQSLGGGYFSVKPKMVEEYITNYKDWNPDLIGEPMRRRAERQVDRFWMARFEATYQQEKVKAQKTAILAAIWASVKDITDQLRAPEAPLSAALFPDSGTDLPAGWWLVKRGFQNRDPFDEGRSGVFRSWRQEFTISRAKGFQLRPNGLWCLPPSNCKMPALAFTVFIMMDAESEPVASAAGSIEYSIQHNGWTRVGQHAAWRYDPNLSAFDFAIGPYLVFVRMKEWHGERATQEIGMHFARLIAARIQAQSKTQGAGGL